MDFSSLVLMEMDKKSGLIIRELGSYEVSEGAEYITKMFYDGDSVNVYFDTNKDVEEWEYCAIFDLFNTDEFEKKGYSIEEIDDEYNPTWLIKFQYSDDHGIMVDSLKNMCALIKSCIIKVFDDIKGKEEEYK